MKKHTVIVKNPTTGALAEDTIYSEMSARELKSSGKLSELGVMTVISTDRASHPSPAVMVSALQQLGVDVARFYAMCDEINNLQQ